MRRNKLFVFLLLIVLLCALPLTGCANNTVTSTTTVTTTNDAPTYSNTDSTEHNNSAVNPDAENKPTDSGNNSAPITETNSAGTNDTNDITDAIDSSDSNSNEISPTTDITDSASSNSGELHCTISINCSAINDHLADLDESKVDFVPNDGLLLNPTEVVFYEGENAFNVLLRTCKQNKLHMEYRDTPIYNSAYICGIGNLYEFDCGDLSGWMYAVNGTFPNYGCSQYNMADGDTLEFIYTCDLGATEQANINL